MDEYDTDGEGQESSPDEVEPIEEELPEGDMVPKALLVKARNEARSLRSKFARSELATEYGKDVVELVPNSLPLQEQRDLAAKLKDRLSQPAPTQGSEERPAAPEAPPVEPTEAEKRIAAIVKPRESAASTDKSWTYSEYKQALGNPDTHAEAMRARVAGLVDESTYAP